MAAHMFVRPATRFLRTLNHVTRPVAQCARCLLTQAYSCDDVWNSRLESNLFKQVNPDVFIQKIQEKVERKLPVPALDMDILINKLQTMRRNQLNFVQDMYERFRLCQDAIEMYDSTSYAYMRALVHFNDTERLLGLLTDKMKYGIFLNYHMANMLLDSFIENKQYEEAAIIAVDQMLQEDFSNPITRMLSWWASHLYWKEVLLQQEPAEPAAPEEGEEEDEWIPVRYIINPFYHDHFDIPTFGQKVGKTLMMIGQLHGEDLGRNYELIGCGLHHRFQAGIELLKKISHSPDMHIAKEALDAFQSTFANFQSEEPNPEKEPGELTIEDVRPRITEDMKKEYEQQLQEVIQDLQAANKIKDEDITSQLSDLVKSEIPKHETRDIEEQRRLFSEWNERRQKELDMHVARLQDQQKRYDIAKKLRELQEKEEKLSFFENEDNIKVAIKYSAAKEEATDILQEEIYVESPGER